MPLKIVVTWKFHSSGFRTTFRSQRVNGFKALLKPARQHFLPNFLLMSGKLSWKKSLLVRSWMLGPCFSTLTNYHMYSRQNWKKLAQQVQKHISSKLLPFYKYFIAFLESTYNFAHFKEKDRLHSSIISEVTSSEDCGYRKFNSSRFRTPFLSQSVNGFQTLLKPARKRFLPNFLFIPEKLT